MKTPQERFEASFELEPNTGCWLWTASTNGDGYAQFRVDGRVVRVHRWAYERLVGPVPEGFQLDHKCRVRSCVNPAHLEPVTSKENTRRGLLPTLMRGNALARGKHNRAKLTADEVRAIRADSRPQKTVAAEYGIHQTQVSRIRRGTNWVRSACMLFVCAALALTACGEGFDPPHPVRDAGQPPASAVGSWHGMAVETGPAGARVMGISATVSPANPPVYPVPSLQYPNCGELTLEVSGRIAGCAQNGTWTLSADGQQLSLQFTFVYVGVTFQVDLPLNRVEQLEAP